MAKKKKPKHEPPAQLKPRLLHRQSHRGYTEEPALAMFPDAGEAVDRFEQERYTKDAQRRREAGRTARRQAEALLPVEAQIAKLQAEAKRRRVNIRDEVRLIGKLKREGRPTDNPVRDICRKLDRDLAA